jgi:Leucine-rich repeat (LRR) protein
MLTKLQSLSIGIYSLKDFDFLSGLPDSGLRKLSLGATKSKKPSLRHLERFGELRKLYIEGQEKDIDVIAKLPRLEDLTLRSVTVKDLGFLRYLSNLWSLDIKLGGTNNLSALAGMDRIKYLELWQIRGLKDISVISTMRGLQYIFLQSLPHIATIPDLSKLLALRRIHLDNMKGLNDITALATAPLLEELMHCSARGMKPAHYADLLASKTLKRIFVGFGSIGKSNELLIQAHSVGIKQYKHSQFSFT